MDLIYRIIFWTCCFMILYHYFFFPLVIFLLARGKKPPLKKASFAPTITYIVAAYNEEKVIAEKMENIFSLQYPPEKLEVIVVSDGSTDQTATLVTHFQNLAPEGMKVLSLHSPERQGKTAALNRAVLQAKNEILVFSDANSFFDRDALSHLTATFHDDQVGGVCGRKAILHEGARARREAEKGDSLFWDFESQLKWRQGLIHSISTADGEIFAVRRKLYPFLPSHIINDDQGITFSLYRQGKRILYEPAAITWERASLSLQDDFNVKSRMVCGGWQILWENRDWKRPYLDFFVWQFFSHKVLRYSMGFILLALFLATFPLQGHGDIYFLALLVQLIFYSLAILGKVLPGKKIRGSAVFYFPLYYCTVNLAAMRGFFYFLQNKSVGSIWRKAMR